MTAAQILAALSISNTFEIYNLTAPYNTGQFSDITDWAALPITTAAGDTVKIIAKVVNPVGITVYENAGYATDDYTSPDTDLTDLVSPLFTLANLTGTHIPVDGIYTFYLKCQVTPFGESAITVAKDFTFELNQNVVPALSLTDTYNCNNATYTSVDSTDYATAATLQGFSVTTITRSHITQPPLNSLKSDGSTPQTSVTGTSQTNYLAANDNPLWTGSYQSSIQTNVTYRKNNGYILVHVPVVTQATTVACDEDLCNLFCCLKGLISSYISYKSTNTAKAAEYLAKWDAGNRYIIAIREAKACNNATLQASYTELFYTVTECDPDCDCGCTDGPAPVIPTVSINGADGTDGSQILSGTTVPDNAAGNEGDYYIRTTNGFLYKKTGPSAWSYLFTMIGATGATGAAGASGAVVLYNNFAAQATTTALAWETVDSYEVPIAQLSTNGDEVTFEATYTTPSNTSNTQNTRILFNGNTIIDSGIYAGFFASNVQKIVVSGRIVRLSNTTARIQLKVTFYSDGYSWLAESRQILASLASLNFTTTAYTIAQQAYSAVIGDIVSESLEVIYNHKS